MKRDEAEAIARRHIKFSYFSWFTEDYFVLAEVDDITFAKLEALSIEFGTKNINIGCDTGCSSDRTHSREIYIDKRTT